MPLQNAIYFLLIYFQLIFEFINKQVPKNLAGKANIKHCCRDNTSLLYIQKIVRPPLFLTDTKIIRINLVGNSRLMQRGIKIKI